MRINGNKLIIKRSSLKCFTLFILLSEIYVMLVIPIHEVGHAMWCEYFTYDCEVLSIGFQLTPLNLNGGGFVHGIGKFSTSDIIELPTDSNLGQLNFSTIKNYSYELKYDGKEFDFRFKFRDINNLGNVTLYGKRTELPFKERLNIFSHRLQIISGPIFQLLFLWVFILFLKKIKYHLNFIVPFLLFHTFVYARGIKGEVFKFFNWIWDDLHRLIWNIIFMLITIYIFHWMNKK